MALKAFIPAFLRILSYHDDRQIYKAYRVPVADRCARANLPGRVHKRPHPGNFEEKKAGGSRKYGLSWYFMCQWPNFPNGPEGFYQNCNRKGIYRSGHYDLARKLAAMAAAGFPSGADRSHAAKVAELASAIANFQPGQRLVTDRTGSRIEHAALFRFGALSESEVDKPI